MKAQPEPKIGDLVIRNKSVPMIRHVGVVVGSNAVVQNTPEKGEHLATLSEFAAGNPIELLPSGADPQAVSIRTARVLANPQPYRVIGRNCEDTAYEIVQGVAKSPQLVTGALVGILLLFVLARR